MGTDKDKIIQQLQQEIMNLEDRLLVAEDDVERTHHLLRHARSELISLRCELAHATQAKRRGIRQAHHQDAPQACPPMSAQPAVRLNKKTILVVDGQLPQHDRESGARSLHSYMRLFLAMGYDVAFLPNDFVQAQPYADGLMELGVKVLTGPYYENHWREWMEQNANFLAAAVVCHLQVTHRFVRFLKRNTHARILYFAVELNVKQQPGEKAPEQQRLEDAISRTVMRDADAVLLFDDKQKQSVEQKYGVKAVRIPLYFYYDIAPRKTAYGQTKGLFFVGSFLHDSNVDAILWFADEVLPLIYQALPGVELAIAGAGAPAEVLALQSELVHIMGQVEDDELAELYGGARVCIVPMRRGEGVKGKTVEAMYYGVPLVSTQTGLAGLPEIEEVILPADTKEAFAAQVVQKYLNESEWKQQSEAYRKYLLAHASFEAAKSAMEEVLR